MHKKNHRSRGYLTTALLVTFVLTVPIGSASASWFPDLIFPKDEPVPNTKADKLVTGTIPRSKRHDERDFLSKETPMRPSRGNRANSKEGQP